MVNPFIHSQQKKYSRGYTMLELLIVMMLIGVIMPTVFSIIFVLLQQHVKIYRLIETKRQGDRIMTFMKEKIAREAYIIRSGSVGAPGAIQCGTPNSTYTSSTGSNFVLMKGTAAASQRFAFYMNSTNMFIQDSLPALNTSLNDSKVSVSNFQIQCYRRNTISPQLVGLTFTVTFNDSTPTPTEGVTTLTYHTKIKIRY